MKPQRKATPMPSLYHPVLLQPVIQGLVTGQPQQLRRPRPVALRLVQRPIQIMPGHFRQQILKIEACRQRPFQHIIVPGSRQQ